MIHHRLRGHIISEYISIPKFAHQLNMPVSVLRRCLSGQTRSPEKLKLISDKLGFDIRPFFHLKVFNND